MKTIFKLLGGLILLLGLWSCEKDEFESFGLNTSKTVESKAGQNFNNGMINQYSHDVVILWNELLSRSIDNRMPQPAEVKIYAMVTLAMHDALNNVVPKYETYALNNLQVDASGITHKNIHAIADAAVSQAAHDMIVLLYSDATAAAGALLSQILSGIPDSDLKTRGITIGKQAAEAMLAKRANDAPLGFFPYVGGTEPGQYRTFPNPPRWTADVAYAPNLGSMTPFGIESGSQFRNEAPYSLNSPEYIADYNEVKALGCTTCPGRTLVQTQLGVFWIENTSSSMNRMARALIAQRKLDGWEAARLIGLIQMSQIDAYIASFDGKFHFNFWRPITAIRAGDSDGVDETEGNAEWSTTFPTPPNPDFPSTHAYAGGAAAAIFKAFFKSDQAHLVLTSPYYSAGVERHIRTFSQMSYENAISRIYIGYHFRQAVEVGERQGKQLGEYVYENNLRELKKVL